MQIAFFTTTRAEFGLLSPLIRAVDQSADLEHLLFVGGTHLSDQHGHTIDEIKNENFIITDTFDFISEDSNPVTLFKSTAVEVNELSRIFENYQIDAICILGDRYELLPIIQAAIFFQKAIIHIHGGEKSEGVIDEQIRHMITKAAHIHFAACDEYANNIRRMGEASWRVFNTGALAVDNMKSIQKVSKEVIFRELNLDKSKDLVLLTYHPVTLEKNLRPVIQIQNIFSALQSFDLQIVITAPNMEVDRNELLDEIMKQVDSNKHYHYIESLGSKKYLSLIPHCKFVIGNSSSGIIEVPYFKIPTINIGKRQKGRIRHQSIIDTDYSVKSIKDAIEKTIQEDFLNSFKNMEYKFGDGNAANRMVDFLENLPKNKDVLQKKLDFPC